MALNWDRIPGVVAKYAFLYVILTLLYAFIAGAIVSAVLFGGRPLHHRTLVAITWVALPGSLICTFQFGYVLMRVLRELARLAQRRPSFSISETSRTPVR
jgi:hypothetical protein